VFQLSGESLDNLKKFGNAQLILPKGSDRINEFSDVDTPIAIRVVLITYIGELTAM
jgi:hypothetical protein